MTKDEIRVVTQLQRQGLGYRRISAITNISLNTVKTHCKRHPVEKSELENASELFCKQCGKAIERIPNKKAKQFCSDQCRMAWWNGHRELVERKTFTKSTCLFCGSEFQVYGSAERKFCSLECSAAFRKRKVVDA